MKEKRWIATFVVAMLALAILAYPALGDTGPVRYVKHDASGGNDGSTWADAYPHLQDALAAAQPGEEIWVAAGVYYPDEGVGQTENDRTATFTLQPGVALYGGFAGSETTRDVRDWTTNITVLSGDIDGDDGTDAHGVVTDTANVAGANAYHVVTGGGVTETARLDGFTVTAGDADGPYAGQKRGGGMYNFSSSPTLANLIFSGNQATDYGGGMYNEYSSPILTNVRFIANASTTSFYGGGMSNWEESNPALTDVIFTANEANYGGGMANNSNSNPTLTNVTFSGNQAVREGGGMNNSSSSPTLTDVTFSGNQAEFGGGMRNLNGTPTLTNVTFSGNQATSQGGGMSNFGASPTLTNVTFGGNYATEGGGVYNDTSSNPTLVNA
ncbi:MAG: hypothetical protein ACLFV5_11850, partial [Anaerolineales bacterium]